MRVPRTILFKKAKYRMKDDSELKKQYLEARFPGYKPCKGGLEKISDSEK